MCSIELSEIYPIRVTTLVKGGKYSKAVDACKKRKLDPAPIVNFVIENVLNIPTLLERGDEAEATHVCISSIGVVNPGIILSILNIDTYPILLKTYLMEIHRKGLADRRITILLFNLIAKYQDSALVDQICRELRDEKASLEGGIPLPMETGHFLEKFDGEAAVEVLEKANMMNEVASLSKAIGISGYQIATMIRKEGDVLGAAREINAICDQEIGKNMLLQFGREILKKDPNAGAILSSAASKAWGAFGENENELLALFWGFREATRMFVEKAIEKRPSLLYGSVFIEHLIPEDKEQVIQLIRNKGFLFDEASVLDACIEAKFVKGVCALLCRQNRVSDAFEYAMSMKDPVLMVEFLNIGSNLSREEYSKLFRFFVVEDNLAGIENSEDIVYRICKNCIGPLPVEYVARGLLKLGSLGAKVIGTLGLNQPKQYDRQLSEVNEEIKRIKDEIRAISNEPYTFTTSCCSICMEPITFPCVIFRCGHCFHKACTGSSVDCCVCGPAPASTDDFY